MSTNRIHVNNYASTLNGAINSSTTSIVITSATGLPTLSGSQYYFLTLEGGGNVEIVKVTARTTTTLTVVRGQDGTSGTAFSDGAIISARLTRDAIDSKLPDDEDVLPDTDASYDLGSGTYQFKDLYLSGNTVIGGDVSGTTIGGITEANLVDKSANETITGNWDFGGASSLEIPNGAAPTVDAAGEVAVDTTITDHTGLMTYHDGTEALYVIALPTANLTTIDGHAVTYNATNNEFEMSAVSGTGDAWSDAVDADIVPDADGTRDLGSTTNRFAQAHIDQIQFEDAAGIYDDSGNEHLLFRKTASAVNHFEMTHAATGGDLQIDAVGTDATIPIQINPKGNAELEFNTTSVDIAQHLRHIGDLTTSLNFSANATIELVTSGVARLDCTDSGVRLGAANARVTTILDEDTMSSDSATALATQQSIKAYVDTNAGITNVVDDTTPQLGGMLDVNGNAIGDGTRELLTFTEDASAVNHFNIENQATGSGAILSAAGDDANIDFIANPKGTGNIKLGNYTFDGDQTVGAGQDNYVMTYDNSSGLISLEAASGGGSGKILQVVNTTYTTAGTTTTTIPVDNTIPQNTEGAEFFTAAITPNNTNNKLVIFVDLAVSVSTTAWVTGALFQDSTANALAAKYTYVTTGTAGHSMSLVHYMTAGTASATTFKVRVGPSGGTLTMNGNSGAALYGGVMASSITIYEVEV